MKNGKKIIGVNLSKSKLFNTFEVPDELVNKAT